MISCAEDFVEGTFQVEGPVSVNAPGWELAGSLWPRQRWHVLGGMRGALKFRVAN